MKDWIKKQFEMTPNRRLLLAFTLGTVQAGIIYGMLMDWHGQAYYIEMVTNHWHEMHWGWWAIPWTVILFFYVRNSSNFVKETLWMTIKNPAKVRISEDEVWGRQVHPIAPPPPGSRPPPPPPPPPKRTLPPKRL